MTLSAEVRLLPAPMIVEELNARIMHHVLKAIVSGMPLQDIRDVLENAVFVVNEIE